MSFTKICNLLLVIFLSFSFSACSDAEPQAKTPTKKEQQKRRAAQKAKAKKASNKNSYWNELKKATGMTDQQQKSLMRITKKYDVKRKAVPKVNGKPNRKKLMQLNQAQAKEVKKLLGQNLLAKKKAFDKRWKAKQKR